MRYLLMLMLLKTSLVFAFQPFVIKDIQVDGLQRVSVGTVFNYLSLSVGDEVDQEKLSKAVRKLFSYGMFKDISVQHNEGVLIIKVLEMPIITSIEFTGNKDIDKETLLAAYKRLEIAPSMVLNKQKLEKAALELQQQYIAKGRYGTKVINHQIPMERNRVALKIEVQEGVQALVAEIKFIGNKSFDHDELLDQVLLKPTNWWNIFSTRDRFSQEILLGDSDRISNFYLNNGYKNFKMNSQSVVLARDKKHIIISYNFEEGEKVTVRNTVVTGVEQKDIRQRLQQEIEIKPKSVYSKQKIIKAKKKMENKVGDYGYAMASVKTTTTAVGDGSQVDIDFSTDLGQLTYIRKIIINGNTMTRDYVIRREMRLFEGGKFNASDMRNSLSRLRRLGYFSAVNATVLPVESSNNQIDLLVNVVEASAGNAQMGVTYSERSGAGLNISLSHNNVLGSGKKFSINFVTDQVTKQNYLSLTDPYFTKDGISLSYSVFNRKTDTSNIGEASYIKNSIGFNFNFGVPINEYDKIFFGSKIEEADFSCGSSFDECINYVERYNSSVRGEKHRFNLLSLFLSWSKDTRNTSIFPTEGQLQTLSYNYGFGDAKFDKYSYSHLIYLPLFEKSTFKITGKLSTGKSKDGELPFFERYFAGGIGSVRGFYSGSLSDVNEADNNLGGSFRSIFNLDFITPFILAPDAPSVRMTTFIDAGYAFKNQDEFDFDNLNSSYGVGVLWITPVAPLSFTYANAMNSTDADNERKFQFQLGYSF